MAGCRKNAYNATPSCARPARRPRWLAGSAAVVAVVGMLQQIRSVGASFTYGESIDVLVTAQEQLSLTFTGEDADALAISFQQCSGSRYLRMEIDYDGVGELRDEVTIESSMCHRIVGPGASVDDVAVDYDNICAFRNSGPVGNGYTEESTTLTSSDVGSGVLTASPANVTVTLTNNGVVSSTAQLVLYSTGYTATNAGASIDRVHTDKEQDENTFTVDAEFQANGAGDENFCFGGSCAVLAYYMVVDDESDDMLFGTACQARDHGILVFEGYTEGDDVDDDGETDDATTETAGVQTVPTLQSTTAFELEACIQFPKNTAATYMVYLIVSPDTESYSRVGYSLQDNLIYESPEIVVEDNMDTTCPEIIVETNDDDESNGAGRALVTPVSVLLAMLAMALGGAVVARASF